MPAKISADQCYFGAAARSLRAVGSNYQIRKLPITFRQRCEALAANHIEFPQCFELPNACGKFAISAISRMLPEAHYKIRSIGYFPQNPIVYLLGAMPMLCIFPS